MAVLDLQVFIRERLRAFDENMDVSAGSPSDVQLVQPILRRLGTDPFTVDLAVFLNDRLRQAFPELATDEGDALTDLLVKPATLLWDPFVREAFRVRNSLSFRDPTTLTTDEAEALGANLFSERERGDRARGTARVFFTQPRTITVSPVNFFTSKTGLHFFPDGGQSITMEEMLLNLDGSLYYFDVSVIAENPGVTYNIGPNELITVANMEGTIRVTNLRRFRSGQQEETPVEFVSRTQQELTERSMVTLRGIGARVSRAFPEVTRLGVVGFGDPEMQRDVLRGGGLGAPLAGGVLGQTTIDGEGQPATRRFRVFDAGVDFTALVNPLSPGSFVLTVFSVFSGPPQVRDLAVRSAVSADTIELEEQVLLPFYTGRSWTLRKKELTLSGIPGGILFPDSAEGTVTIPDDVVHIGGLYDVSVRGSDIDESSLVIENLTDSEPAAGGVLLNMGLSAAGQVTLGDLVLGTSYAVGDAIYTALSEARQFGFTLQIIEGPNAGNYRVIDVVQATGSAPEVTLSVAISVVVGNFRWRLVDTIEIDLVEPKDTRVSGSDLQSIQNTDIVSTAGSVNLLALGVSVGDTLRIHDGLDAGDFTVLALPAFNSIRVDRVLSATSAALNYTIFRANTAGGVQRPLVRVTKVELLDTSGQPVGSIIPYAKPVDIQSRAFENPGRGVKVDITDARLGIVSRPDPGGGFPIGGLNLTIQFASGVTGYPLVIVTFSAGNKTAEQAVSEINAQAAISIGVNTVLATVVDGDRVGIVPLDPYTRVTLGTARAALFGDTQLRTSSDIRSDSVDTSGGWSAVTPAINQDNLDAAQVIDGHQVGFYGNLSLGAELSSTPAYDGLFSGDIALADTMSAFAPEVGRRVQVGSRSIGSARCFFLEPTSIELNRSSFFSATSPGGAAVRFFPDPTLGAVRIPAPPTTSMPKDGSSTGGTTNFTSASQDFILSAIIPGDQLVIRFVPIIGMVALTDPVVNLALKSIILALDGGADQTIIFGSDLSGFPTDVSRAGVSSQINNAVGRAIASISGTNHLEIETDVSAVIRSTGSANAILGISTVTDTDNRSPHQGTYAVTVVGVPTADTLTVSPAFPLFATVGRQAFEVNRPGTQRISSTQMNSNTAEAGLFFFDVELVSEGTGNIFNIESDQQLLLTGFRSDGYFLSTDDSNLTFSAVERPKLHLSRSILEVGVSDNPRNATLITGQNVEITYERSTLVSDVQNFASSETERVVCANPLARHLVPHFVRFDFEYIGGSRAELVLTDIQNYVRALFPQDLLESSDLVDIAYQRGASSVTSPIDLIAVVHQYDRSVQAQRSQNSLNTGRLAAFIPDRVNVNRRSG